MPFALLLFTLVPVLAGAQTFRFNDPNGRDTVSFVLSAPFERINGLSNALTGEVQVEKDVVRGAFWVPVKSLKTGNGLRDEHLANDRWLDAARHPDLLFTFAGLKLPGALEPGKPVKLTVQGEFTIRGVKKMEPVEIEATWHRESELTRSRAPGELLHVAATFQIPIEAYGIQRTRALLLKVGDVAKVSVDAWGSTQLKLPTAEASPL